ncbi:hypothetical protein, partial [Nostoc sp. JL34]|uniref:hypothetical protein n=1 Tax=Nostoc sp. JL34 TaxID=2815397 RepID=UPI0025F79A86
MALRKGKIIEAAGVQRSRGAEEQRSRGERRSLRYCVRIFKNSSLHPCTPAPLQSLHCQPFSLT